MIDPQADDFSRSDAPIPEDVLAESPADVAFVVPASAYDSIATDDELARPSDPFPFQSIPFAGPDLAGAAGDRGSWPIPGGAARLAGDPVRPRDPGRDDPREGRGSAPRRAPGVQGGPAALGDAADLRGPDPAPRRRGEDGFRLRGARRRFGEVRALLGSIQQGIEDILYRQGIEPFIHDAETFDARRQRAVTTTPTDDPSLARKVAERHRKGFASGEKVIRPEVVSVYTFKPKPAPADV